MGHDLTDTGPVLRDGWAGVGGNTTPVVKTKAASAAVKPQTAKSTRWTLGVKRASPAANMQPAGTTSGRR